MSKIIYAILVILATSCGLQSQMFEVKVDTIYLDIKQIARPATRVSLTHAVKYNDKYYIFFNERGLYSSVTMKRFLVISRDGTLLNSIDVPNEINETVYFDFFIRNDSLLAKTYSDHDCFYFDLKEMKWIRIKEIDDSVYEDENYIIAYLSFGEWGQTTWFIDKQTKTEYILGAYGTQVNLLDGKYYLTSAVEILEIENPKKLQQCDKDYYYQKVGKKVRYYEGTNSLIGSTAIYQDTTFSPSFLILDDLKQVIITSFVANNRLYQLFSDSISTYVGIIENGRLVPVQDIGKEYSTFNWYYSYRGNNLGNNSRFLKFEEDDNTFGFIEIDHNKISIRYLIHNLDSLEYLGADGFEKVMTLALANPEKLSLEQAASLEHEIGGLDMKIDRVGTSHNGIYPEIYSQMAVKAKRFVKVEDKNIAQTTEYLYTAGDEKVKSIFIEWSKTEPYLATYSFSFLSDHNPGIAERFTRKQTEIVEIISGQLGVAPEKLDRGDGYIQLTWVSDAGVEIVLYGYEPFDETKEIRMVINLN